MPSDILQALLNCVLELEDREESKVKSLIKNLSYIIGYTIGFIRARLGLKK